MYAPVGSASPEKMETGVFALRARNNKKEVTMNDSGREKLALYNTFETTTTTTATHRGPALPALGDPPRKREAGERDGVCTVPGRACG